MKNALMIVALLMLTAVPASAHEKRNVQGYDLVVGFVNEPAFSGQINAIDLRVSHEGKPVEGLEETLKAVVFYGEASRGIDLKKRYGQPGAYAGHFIPSAPGDYAFRFDGKISDLEISETFRTADGKFSRVGDSAEITFP